jgi:hypothetical protein
MKMMIYQKVMFQLIRLKVDIAFSFILKYRIIYLEAPKGEKRKRNPDNQQENGVENDNDEENDDGPPRKI